MVKAANHTIPQELGLPPLPRWSRNDAPVHDFGDAAFRAGAALALLDARVRAEAPFAGAWRSRLALKAAAASARIARRGEDEAMLRDALYLRRAGDDPGPAGRMLLACRALDRSAALDDDAVLHAAGLFGLTVDDALRAAIDAVQAIAGNASEPAPFAAAKTAGIVMAQRPDAELLALWLADAVLAACVKWPRPVPLIADALLDRSLRIDGRRPHPADAIWPQSCCAAYAGAAARACDLYAALERNAKKLLATVARSRAKGAAAAAEKFLAEDAVAASAPIAAMTDRALRRLFERLVALDAVRELTGRSTFRLYGL